MAKQCKSCGNYYSGDYCDKCGYGKKNVPSKIPAKYKKATKPERFRTEEDKKLYAKWEKEKLEEKASAKAKNPNANKAFLGAVAVVAVLIIFIALYQSGAIFSNTRTEVVEQYFKSIQTGDFDSFVKCFPKEIKSEYEADRETSKLSKDDYMDALYADFKEEYGEDYTITVDFGSETQLDPEEYDMSGYKTAHGSAPSISEVYEMVVNITFEGSKKTDEAKLYMYVAKTSGYWRVFGLTEDVGIMTEEDAQSAAENTQ